MPNFCLTWLFLMTRRSPKLLNMNVETMVELDFLGYTLRTQTLQISGVCLNTPAIIRIYSTGDQEHSNFDGTGT